MKKEHSDCSRNMLRKWVIDRDDINSSKINRKRTALARQFLNFQNIDPWSLYISDFHTKNGKAAIFYKCIKPIRTTWRWWVVNFPFFFLINKYHIEPNHEINQNEHRKKIVSEIQDQDKNILLVAIYLQTTKYTKKRILYNPAFWTQLCRFLLIHYNGILLPKI